MMKLVNQKILFIAPDFFNYAQLIKAELIKLGAQVTFIPDAPNNHFIKLYYSIFPNRINDVYHRYYLSVKQKIANDFDIIFIIKGNRIPAFFYEYLKMKNPNAFFIQYHWDDMYVPSNKGIEGTFKYFDKIYSYDILDAKEKKIECRPFCFFPNFNLKEYQYQNYNKRYDLFFIGSYSKSRDQTLINFWENITNDISIKKHYYINPLFFIKENIPIKRVNDFSFTKLSYQQMTKLLFQSYSSLDIPFEKQKGLTTRSFEAILGKTKIITTNENVKLYKLYNPENYYIIDKNNPRVDVSWFKTPYKSLSDEIIYYYSIDCWIKTIFKY